MLFGEVLDGAEAERVGLVWRCVDDDELLAHRAGHGGQGRGRPARARPQDEADDLIDMADIRHHDDAVARELEPQVWSIQQPDFRERLAALQAEDHQPLERYSTHSLRSSSRRSSHSSAVIA